MTIAPDPRFWQEFGPIADLHEPAFHAHLPDEEVLALPIRQHPDGVHGLASLIVNQASFEVQQRLCAALAAKLGTFGIEVVIGLPTLGLTIAAQVAAALGHSRYVPAGTSRKFWYDAIYSVPVSSVTTRDEKRLWLDPRLIPLLRGKRVALIDDVISTGQSLRAGLELLQTAGVRPVAAGVLMRQTGRWLELWPPTIPLLYLFDTPLLARAGEAWTAISTSWPDPGSAPTTPL